MTTCPYIFGAGVFLRKYGPIVARWDNEADIPANVAGDSLWTILQTRECHKISAGISREGQTVCYVQTAHAWRMLPGLGIAGYPEVLMKGPFRWTDSP